MSGNTGITGNTQGTDRPWSSTGGIVAPSTQIQLMSDAERDASGVITPSNANKISEVIIGMISWAKSQANRTTVVLGAALTRLKQILTFRTTTTGAISRRQIDSATVASVTFQTNSPFATNFFAGQGNNVSVAYDNINGNANNNPAMDSVLGVVASRGILQINNANPTQYQRIVRARFRIAAWRNGSTSPLLRYGVRGDSDRESAVLHLERDNSGLWLNYQQTNGTAYRFSIGVRHGRAANAAHFQIGDIVNLDVENHLTDPTDASSALQLVVVANVEDAAGNLVDVMQFNDTGPSPTELNIPALASASHFDFGRVRWYSGDASQADSAPAAYVETWQNVANTPLNELLRHSQLQTVNSHPVTDTEKLGGFWHGSPVSHMDVGNVVIDAGGFEKNGQPYAEIPEWTANTAYAVGQLRRNNTTPYMCILDHTSPAAFAVGSNWRAI